MTGDLMIEIAESEFPSLSRISLNAARWHPLPQTAVVAVQRHLARRSAGGGWDSDISSMAQDGARQQFADLINADPQDIALVPSTTLAEQAVVRSLGLPQSGAVVTDLLHFDGSIYAYDGLAAGGADVRFVEPRDGRIDLADVARELAKGGVRLVAVSAVSNTTGFAHDLPALCALAHAHGAYVYADIIQLAGASPFDVVVSGVDFCATSSFKWLMGEMGLGFLWVKRDVLDRLDRPTFGYRQLADWIEPWPPVGPRAWGTIAGAAGLFEGGSLPVGAAVATEASIAMLSAIGIDRIAEHREPLIGQLVTGMSALGHACITPVGSPAPFRVFDAARIENMDARLRAANIDASVMGTTLRVSVSIYNTPADIDALLSALA